MAAIACESYTAFAFVVTVALDAVLIEDRLNVAGEIDDFRYVFNWFYFAGSTAECHEFGLAAQVRCFCALLVAAYGAEGFSRLKSDETAHLFDRKIVFVKCREIDAPERRNFE